MILNNLADPDSYRIPRTATGWNVGPFGIFDHCQDQSFYAFLEEKNLFVLMPKYITIPLVKNIKRL